MVEMSVELQNLCFPFLDPQEVKVLLGFMTPVTVKSGCGLFAIGDPAECLYVISSGRIAVRKKTGFGDRMQVVALLDPGAPLGESGMLDGQFRGATLTAVTDSNLLSLSRQAFDEISATDPALALKFMKWLMGRLSLRLKKSSDRLAHIL